MPKTKKKADILPRTRALEASTPLKEYTLIYNTLLNFTYRGAYMSEIEL